MRVRFFAGLIAALSIGSLTYFALFRTEPIDPSILLLESVDPSPDLQPLVALPALTKVDRRVVEPAGLKSPRYCLLVFGPDANTRVWLIEDGDTIYVDRNANGDLTDAGESALPSKRSEFMSVGVGGIGEEPYRDWDYTLGDLAPSDGSERHANLELTRYQEGDKASKYVLSVRVRGVLPQEAGWGPIFAPSRNTAPVIHFGGAVVPRLVRTPALHMSYRRDELRLCIGTPGLGGDSFAYISCDAVPENIQPVVEIAWPTNGIELTERFALARRC
jgi:hypothetical protein